MGWYKWKFGRLAFTGWAGDDGEILDGDGWWVPLRWTGGRLYWLSHEKMCLFA